MLGVRDMSSEYMWNKFKNDKQFWLMNYYRSFRDYGPRKEMLSAEIRQSLRSKPWVTLSLSKCAGRIDRSSLVPLGIKGEFSFTIFESATYSNNFFYRL